MTRERRILVLCTGTGAVGDSKAVAESLAAQGATVLVRECDGRYDALLDDIAAADSVVCLS